MLCCFRKRAHSIEYDPQAPPAWTPAPEQSRRDGLYEDAPAEEFEAAEAWCEVNPPHPPKLLPSHIVERINAEGCGAWDIEHPTSSRFHGTVSQEKNGTGATINVKTTSHCKSFCLMSDLPILAGLYDAQGKQGVYFEIRIISLQGIIALGTSCKPYPQYRLPGWNRLSAGLHSDDLSKFYEDPNGGADYISHHPQFSYLSTRGLRAGDVWGCGYEFAGGSLFYTHNGVRLPSAFSGLYVPRQAHDVYAAIGVEGHNELEVNFGGDRFAWKEGNEWAWRVEGHVGRMETRFAPGSNSGFAGLPPTEDLPSYVESQ